MTLTIYDVSGRLIRRLVNGTYPAGVHQVVWDARDESGAPVASGVYLYRLNVRGLVSGKTFRQTRKMLLLK